MTTKIAHKSKEMDQYTSNVLQNGFSRRRFLTHAAMGTGAVAFAGLTGGAAEAAEQPLNADIAKSADGGATLDFMPRPKPVADKRYSFYKNL